MILPIFTNVPPCLHLWTIVIQPLDIPQTGTKVRFIWLQIVKQKESVRAAPVPFFKFQIVVLLQVPTF